MDLTKYSRIAFQFSGGKDSLAALYLLQDDWEQMTVFVMDTGDMPVEQEKLIAEVLAMVPKSVHVKSDSKAWRWKNGVPVEVLPYEAREPQILGFHPIRQMVMFDQCCAANLWRPMQEVIDAFDPEVVIRGQKSCDPRRGRLVDGQVVDGVLYHYPLESWTDSAVLDYLGDRLPQAYRDGAPSSIDCISCTAYMHEASARLFYLEPRYPREVAFVRQVHAELSVALVSHLELLNG